MNRFTVLTLALALAAPAAAADSKFDAEARARAIAPFLDDEAVFVAHLDVRRLDPDAFADQLAKLGKLPGPSVQAARQFLKDWSAAFTKAGGKDVYLVAGLMDFAVVNRGADSFVIVPLEEGADESALARVAGRGFQVGKKFPGKNVVFGGSEQVFKRLQTLKAAARPDLAKAFAAAGDTAAQVLVLPTADNRRVIEEVLPNLPEVIGGGSSKVLTRGLRWAALGLDLPPKMALRLVVQSSDAAAAKALHGLIDRGLKLVASQEEVRDMFPNVGKLTAQLLPKVEGDRLTLTQTSDQLAAVVEPLLFRTRQAAQRAMSQNNLKQIGIAFHTYYDKYKVFPAAASYDKQGKPLLSWRVHLLPFLGEEELYKEFHLDQPWDGEHNKKLVARIPNVYRSANAKLTAAGKTLYLAPVGEATMFPGRKPVKITDVTDGTSNTIFIVEAAEDAAVVWTKPEDLNYDPKKPLAGLPGPPNKKGINVLLVDGSVRLLPATIKLDTLRALFTRNGGEVIGDDD
jgi:hypothetical protein